LPLYLKLAFEEVRGWSSFTSEDDCRLGEGVDGVIDTLLDRLSLESNHGPLLVGRGLGYLAAARYGLTEDEVLDVLSADQEVWQDFERRAHHTPPEHRLPVIVWSRLFLDIEPYLAERSAPGGTVACFYHRQLAMRVAARFLSEDDGHRLHAALARYFAAQPHWFDSGLSRPNARRASELVRHQIAAEQIDDACGVLTDIEFVAAKCGAGLVFDLGADYATTLTVLPEMQAELEVERNRCERVRRWIAATVEYANASAAGRCVPLPAPPISVAPKSADEINEESRRIIDQPTRLDRVRTFAGFIERECYALLAFGQHPGFALEHALNYAATGLVHRAAKEKAGSPATPMLLRRWSPRSGYKARPALQRALEGHTGAIVCLSLTPDGRRAITGAGDISGQDRTLRLWDLETGRGLLTLEGHAGWVTGVSLTPDGRRAVSAGDDHTLRVWDLETGVCLRALTGLVNVVNCVSATADGRLAISGGYDGSVRVWDLDTGECLRILEERAKPVNCVAITPEGRLAVSGGDDKTVRVWDLQAGVCLRTLEGHTGEVRSLSITPDGRRAVSAG
jgi:hypothetical protein